MSPQMQENKWTVVIWKVTIDIDWSSFGFIWWLKDILKHFGPFSSIAMLNTACAKYFCDACFVRRNA
jgi:hypothetical protein